MGVNRRSFLRRIGAAAIAFTLARHLPGIAPQAPVIEPPELSIEDFQEMYLNPAVDSLVRSIDWQINRLDVYYGSQTLTQDFAVRVQS